MLLHVGHYSSFFVYKSQFRIIEKIVAVLVFTPNSDGVTTADAGKKVNRFQYAERFVLNMKLLQITRIYCVHFVSTDSSSFARETAD